MSIQQHPAKRALGRPSALHWGEVAPDRQTVGFVRFVMVDRVVGYSVTDLRRWEHVLGDIEVLLISAGSELIKVEGVRLLDVRESLDSGRLLEIRQNPRKLASGGGPVISRIEISPA